MKNIFKILVLLIFIIKPIFVYGANLSSYLVMWWFPNSQFSTLTPTKEMCQNCNPDTWIIEKLDLGIGVFNTVSILKGCAKYAFAPQFDLTHMLMFATEKYNYTIDVVSLSTGTVAGTFTLDVSPGTDVDAFQPELIVSPDGSRIFVSWEDGPDYTYVTEVFDGKTYRKIVKYASSLAISSFSNDGKYAYLIGLKKDWNVPVLDLSTMQMLKAIPLPDTVRGMIEGNQFASNIVFYKYNPTVSYMYNIDTGALSVSIPTHEGCDNSFLSPKATWLLCAGKSQVDAYNISTGNWAAVFTTTTEGAIISWANDHTFIYNTTQKLIYFDIKQNKIIKELPIIRPWEKPGWKPEVGK